MKRLSGFFPALAIALLTAWTAQVSAADRPEAAAEPASTNRLEDAAPETDPTADPEWDAPRLRRLAEDAKRAAKIAEEAEPEEEPKEPLSEQDDPFHEFLTLAHAMMVIREQYVEPKSFEELTDAALEGMCAALDPFSTYLVPDMALEEQEETEGHYEGIGLLISEIDGAIFVERPIIGSPAFRAGVRMGDILEAINGVEYDGTDFNGFIGLIDGPIGTKITLRLRNPAGEVRECTIERQRVEIAHVLGGQMLTNNVAYIRIEQFSLNTPEEFSRTLARLHPERLSGLILDLRDNPGGAFVAAVSLANLFLKEGDVIVSSKGRAEEHNETYRAEGELLFPDLKIAILVNGSSASAAELFSAALRDNGRAILVGERTFGKASIQTSFELPDRNQSALKLTVAYYYTPNGELIHKNGLPVDIEVTQDPIEAWLAQIVLIARAEMDIDPSSVLPPDLPAPDKDLALEAALEALLKPAEADPFAEGAAADEDAVPDESADADAASDESAEAAEAEAPADDADTETDEPPPAEADDDASVPDAA